MAVLAKNEKLVELLLSSKASLEIKDNDGLTPLHVAAGKIGEKLGTYNDRRRKC